MDVFGQAIRYLLSVEASQLTQHLVTAAPGEARVRVTFLHRDRQGVRKLLGWLHHHEEAKCGPGRRPAKAELDASNLSIIPESGEMRLGLLCQSQVVRRVRITVAGVPAFLTTHH